MFYLNKENLGELTHPPKNGTSMLNFHSKSVGEKCPLFLANTKRYTIKSGIGSGKYDLFCLSHSGVNFQAQTWIS